MINQLNNKINNSYSSLNYDFILDISDTPFLVENQNRQIEIINTSFLNGLEINDTQQYLYKTNSLSFYEKLSLTFELPDDFVHFFQTVVEKQDIITNKKFISLDNKVFLFNYYPLYKENSFQGHIFTYKIQSISSHQPSLQSNDNSILAFDALPNEIAIYNNKAQFTYVNKAYIPNQAKRLWVNGKTLIDYFSYENLSSQTALFRTNIINKCFQQKKAISWNEQSTTNKYIYLRTCYPLINNNKVEKVIEFAINITAQKQLEEKLNQSVKQLYSLANNVNALVVKTNHKLNIEFLNNSWQNTLSNENSLIGKSLNEIFDITQYDFYEKVFSILAGQNTESKGLIALNDKNNKLKHYKYNLSSTFNVEEDKNGIVATLTDITTEKLQEGQLIELIKKEKELNELKSAFVNMVSHELRTPLTVISSSAEVLELMLKNGKAYDEVTVYTQQIIEQVEKMTSFMQDLLMISKIEAGKISIDIAETNIQKFVERVINQGFNPYKDGRSALLSIKRQSKPAYIDAKLLEHSLQNIIQNAFKYSTNTKDPLIRIGFSNSYFTISVLDYGIGIPKEEIDKLFTSFYRASNTENIPGTGIGLMVTKYFAQQHKGEVMVRSALNKGTIFTIKIPY